MSFSGKYIRKVFSLKKFLFPNLFVSMRVVANQGYVLLKCIRWKIFEQIGICIAYFTFFIITLHEIVTAAEVDLEPSQTYMLELFLKIST